MPDSTFGMREVDTDTKKHKTHDIESEPLPVFDIPHSTAKRKYCSCHVLLSCASTMDGRVTLALHSNCYGTFAN